MSWCNNNHWIEDGKGGLSRISAWHCPACQWKSITVIGYIILAVSIPIVYAFFGDIATPIEESDEEGVSVGFHMVLILWWEALIIFFLYREEIKELRKRLVEVESLANVITKGDLYEICKLYGDDIEKLKKYLQNTKEDLTSTKALERIINHNICAIDSADLPFEEHEIFWKDCKWGSKSIDKKNHWIGLRHRDTALAPILFIASFFLPIIGVIIASFFN